MTITQIISDLYKLSFRSRNSSTRSITSSKIFNYTEIDSDTGTDKLAACTNLDKRHIEETLRQLRGGTAKSAEQNFLQASQIARSTDAGDFNIDRIVATMSRRRRFLRYWQRHKNMMDGITLEPNDVAVLKIAAVTTPDSVLEDEKKPSAISQALRMDSSTTQSTMYSGTGATQFNTPLDESQEAESMIAYASTTVDIHKIVKLPRPPAIATVHSEIRCPYCGIHVHFASRNRSGVASSFAARPAANTSVRTKTVLRETISLQVKERGMSTKDCSIGASGSALSMLISNYPIELRCNSTWNQHTSEMSLRFKSKVYLAPPRRAWLILEPHAFFADMRVRSKKASRTILPSTCRLSPLSVPVAITLLKRERTKTYTKDSHRTLEPKLVRL